MLYFRARLMILLSGSILWLAILPATGKNEGEITIGQPKIGPLFAAQYRYYQSQSAGNISVQNNTADKLYAEISITVAGHAPKSFTTITPLPVGKTTAVPLKIGLDFDKLLTYRKPLALEAAIEIVIRVNSRSEPLLKKQLSAQFQLHNLHRFTSTPPEAMAVFIDVMDHALAEFGQVQISDKTPRKLFELMKEKKILCVGRADQSLQYPRELLRTTIGSNYDCALLYAALLENADIPVALMVSDDYLLVLLHRY